MKFLFSFLLFVTVSAHGEFARSDYNQRFLEYYTSSHLSNYLERLHGHLGPINYQITRIGSSRGEKAIFVIHPRQFERGKKLIILTCRQHGDEGTSNYILEGFLSSLVNQANPQWLQKFQIVIFPMVNPDGADQRTRHNLGGIDLNRNWDPQSNHTREEPEVRVIHQFINNVFKTYQTPVPIALDLHGSFDEDFMYMGDENFVSREYHMLQRAFVSLLGRYNPWQGGNYHLSNGEHGMIRLLFAKVFKINSMTVETPRDILKSNPQNRSTDTLRQEGFAIYRTIFESY